MGFLLSSPKNKKIVALFDIGSGSVGGSYIEYSDKNKIPTILTSFRTEIAFRKTLNFDEYFTDMLSAFKITVDALYKSKAAVPDEIVCVLASPWYLSETRVITTTREKPFIFTKHLADELLQKEIVQLADTYRKKYGEGASGPELFENRIAGVSLNGYPVEHPIDKKARTIEMNMVISLSPKTFLDALRDALSQVFHHKPVSFSSFMLSSFLAVRERYVSPSSYLLLDIGGEVTDVAIVTNDVLKSSLSFPFGKRSFYKYMCSKLGMELRDAQEIFNLYLTDTLSSTRKESLQPLFNSIEKLWLEAFRESISTLPRTLTLPGTIFLTADNDVREWYAQVLCTEEYIQSLMSEHKCQVITLAGPEFLNMCSVKNGKCDPFLMIEAISVGRKFEKN